MVDPAVVAVADEFNQQINFARLNVDDNPEMAGRYQVWSIPMLALFRDGEIVARHEGVPMDASGDVEKATRAWLTAELKK